MDSCAAPAPRPPLRAEDVDWCGIVRVARAVAAVVPGAVDGEGAPPKRAAVERAAQPADADRANASATERALRTAASTSLPVSATAASTLANAPAPSRLALDAQSPAAVCDALDRGERAEDVAAALVDAVDAAFTSGAYSAAPREVVDSFAATAARLAPARAADALVRPLVLRNRGELAHLVAAKLPRAVVPDLADALLADARDDALSDDQLFFWQRAVLVPGVALRDATVAKVVAALELVPPDSKRLAGALLALVKAVGAPLKRHAAALQAVAARAAANKLVAAQAAKELAKVVAGG